MIWCQPMIAHGNWQEIQINRNKSIGEMESGFLCMLIIIGFVKKYMFAKKQDFPNWFVPLVI